MLRWLVGCVREASKPRVPSENRTVHGQIVYLSGLLIRYASQDHDGPPVMKVRDPLIPDERPMSEADNQKPFYEKCVGTEVLAPLGVPV